MALPAQDKPNPADSSVSVFNSTAATQIVGADTSRPSLRITNHINSGANLYITMGITPVPTTTFYSLVLEPGDTYSAPQNEVGLRFTGIFSSAPTIGAFVTVGS